MKSARAPWMASAEKRATETRVEYIVSDEEGSGAGSSGGGRGRYKVRGEKRESEAGVEDGRTRRKAKTGSLPAWAL